MIELELFTINQSFPLAKHFKAKVAPIALKFTENQKPQRSIVNLGVPNKSTNRCIESKHQFLQVCTIVGDFGSQCSALWQVMKIFLALFRILEAFRKQMCLLRRWLALGATILRSLDPQPSVWSYLKIHKRSILAYRTLSIGTWKKNELIKSANVTSKINKVPILNNFNRKKIIKARQINDWNHERTDKKWKVKRMENLSRAQKRTDELQFFQIGILLHFNIFSYFLSEPHLSSWEQ